MKQATDPSTFLKSISMIHLAMFAGQLMMLGVLVFLKQSFIFHFASTDGLFLYLVPGIAILVLFMAPRIYASRIGSISDMQALTQKLESYRGALIIKLAMIEGAALLGIMIYYLTGNMLYIAIALALLLYFFYLKPTKATIQQDAKLSNMEIESIG